MKQQNIDCLRNPSTGEVRVTFLLSNDQFAVVKFFRHDGELFSVKVWSGDYDETKSHWNTLSPVAPDKAKEYFSLGWSEVKKLASLLAPLVKSTN